jgi:hypothetical protein
MNKYKIYFVAIAVLVVGFGVYYGMNNSIVKQITRKGGGIYLFDAS